MKLSGAGPAFAVSAGGVVAERVVIAGDLLVDKLSDPTVSVADKSGTADGVAVTWVSLGPSVTYYLMPLNVYLGGALLLSKLSISAKDSTETGNSDFGVGGAVRIGKDFWLSRDLGLGVSGQLTAARMKDSSAPGSDVYWNSTLATLALQLTYH